MHEERVLLPEGFLLEVEFQSGKKWKLSLKKDGKALVEYSDATGYEFRSVEKLRYDFERDAENAQRQG